LLGCSSLLKLITVAEKKETYKDFEGPNGNENFTRAASTDEPAKGRHAALSSAWLG
jgi:hypothetical protein